MKKIPFILIAVMTLCSVGIQGCSEDDCSLTTTSVARFDFLDSKTHKAVTFTEGVTVAGIVDMGDSLLVDTLFNGAQSYMSLPLSYTESTTYVMHYSETLRDTIVVNHKTIPFVSNIECGTLMHYKVEDLRYTTNVLDSVILVNPEITNEERKNFNVYYRTADE